MTQNFSFPFIHFETRTYLSFIRIIGSYNLLPETYTLFNM